MSKQPAMTVIEAIKIIDEARLLGLNPEADRALEITRETLVFLSRRKKC